MVRQINPETISISPPAISAIPSNTPPSFCFFLACAGSVSHSAVDAKLIPCEVGLRRIDTRAVSPNDSTSYRTVGIIGVQDSERTSWTELGLEWGK